MKVVAMRSLVSRFPFRDAGARLNFANGVDEFTQKSAAPGSQFSPVFPLLRG